MLPRKLTSSNYMLDQRKIVMTSAHVLAQSESASLRKAATVLGASGEEVPEADHLDTHTQKKIKTNQKTIKQMHVCNLLSLSLCIIFILP